ncbi:CBS domain-containing protein [Synechococcus sp. PCC 6312]|uniref:CBS domain-containing protein n=1 Tax=Synechococcus sp. (strain ATCC 27167 / PCC 6312) TaxID=195253 RepID=UPI00029F241F|nr:CBS domain-containing protein [Synechococcus sp. PCC 6312]AFY60614.1 tRNA nucleotidyltransferase/poly(A) polymerase [Synechococcus sp. PCC 6312]
MDIVLCHVTADFDTLGAAAGLAYLHPGTRIVLTGGAHPRVRDFLAVYRDEFPIIAARAVEPRRIQKLWIVDTQARQLLGSATSWLEQPTVEIVVYDHHLGQESDLPPHQAIIEPVGATSTLISEILQAQGIALTPSIATVLALGIHADTGSLTFAATKPRDAAALAWLLQQGANQLTIQEFAGAGLERDLQPLLNEGLAQLQQETIQGYRLSWVLLETPNYLPGLSSLVSALVSASESDFCLLGHCYRWQAVGCHLAIIGRSQIPGLDLAQLFQPLGGGGHAQAAAVTVKTPDPQTVLKTLWSQIKAAIPAAPTAQILMSAPVRTIRPESPIDQAQRVLLRYGHSGLSVVTDGGDLVGVISRRDLDIALHHGFGHAPVKGYMKKPVRTINPETPLNEIQRLMVTYDIGRLPVVDSQRGLVGIVTRTDVLRQLYQLHRPKQPVDQPPHHLPADWLTGFPPGLGEILVTAATLAQTHGWQLYLVGGAVRDYFLRLQDTSYTSAVREFDLVVDGMDQMQQTGAGVVLAQALQAQYPETELQVYGRFQTAALHWPHGSQHSRFAVDIATARSEFYPYPAAHPEVTASSIRQDLYRRDFTINALAIRLTSPQAGELLDFFGGWQDLKTKQIRVLHPNSFIEDPTRIFRAVRFAVRLGFQLDPGSQDLIQSALTSGVFDAMPQREQKRPSLQSRLRNELRYILQLQMGPTDCFPGEKALRQLAQLNALQCLHPKIMLPPDLWGRLSWAWTCLQTYGSPSERQGAWEILLTVLLAALSPISPISDLENLPLRMAQQLHLSGPAQARLAGLPHHLALLAGLMTTSPRPSQLCQAWDALNLDNLILLASQTPPAQGLIEQYLNQWRDFTPPLSGHDLQQLGYPRGPIFAEILKALRIACLDGVVTSPEAALAWLSVYFPLT